MADNLNVQIKRMLIEALKLDGMTIESIVDEAPLFGGGLGLDSLDALQLAMAVEERFGVAVPDGDGGRQAFASVAALADWIRGQSA